MHDTEERFESFATTADIGLIAYGKDLRETFCNAAIGMFALITDPGTVFEKEEVSVEVEGRDREGLLVAWLSELLYLHETQDFLVKGCTIHSLTDQRVAATVRGEKIEALRHPVLKQMKAVTYHQLTVSEEKGQWRARVIFDI